jgi:hypothetical protein
MRGLISFFLILTISVCGYSSNDSSNVKYSLGLTPSAITNITPAFQISQKIEYQNKIAIELHSGFIFSHLNINNINTRGLRLRPSVKYYVVSE